MATSAAPRFLLDTNILVHYTRGKELAVWIENHYNLFALPDYPLICEVTVGELYSLALQKNWDEKKLKELQRLIKMCVVVPLNLEGIHQTYAQIDYYSQKPGPGLSARNMGKNDLWIAATAHVTQATLLACDRDFEHLHPQWIHWEYIDPDSAKNQNQ